MRNPLLATLAAACVITGPVAAQNLVSNPGFESGDFTGWTQGGNTDFSGVDAFAPRSGTFAAFFGPEFVVGTLSQDIATTSGQSYLFSFWLLNESAASPNGFEALWNGTSLVALLDDQSTVYTRYAYSVTATAAATAIEFRFRHQLALWDLDDVSVTAVESDVVPEPATMTLLATGLVGMAAARCRKRTAS